MEMTSDFRNKSLVIGLITLAYITATLAFLFLADITQWIIQAPREVHLTVFYWRNVLMTIGIISFLSAVIINYKTRLLSWKAITINSIIYILLFIGGFILVTYVMFIPQQTTAEFVSIEKADAHVRREDEVFVVEIDGDVRAYPDKWLRQPHIVGDNIGGEEVVMTYCSLSHLGLAYSPYINNKKLDLKVFTQLQNNLIMFDTNTDTPIQQITGTTEHTGESMKEYPTQVMTYKVLKDVYPQALVFYNPPKNIKDTLTRMLLRTVVNWQHELDVPVFPTIDIEEPGLARIHPKEQVWGVKIGDQKVAYTIEYFEKNDWVISTSIGDKDIVLAYYPEYETVGGFERTIDGEKITISGISEIDIHGNTRHGKLIRIPVASEVLWMVWYSFYPETKLNI